MRGKIPTLKPSTRDKYAGMLDQHILPALGEHYVDAGVIWIRRSQWQGRVGTTKTGKVRDVPLPPLLREVLKQHRQRLVRNQARGLSEGLVFPSRVGTYRRNASLRKPLKRALQAAGIADRFTLHGFRRTWNNLLRQVSSSAITQSMIGHETEEMFLHYSHIERDEKHSAVERALAIVKTPVTISQLWSGK